MKWRDAHTAAAARQRIKHGRKRPDMRPRVRYKRIRVNPAAAASDIAVVADVFLMRR